jgi:hypothetical protein
MMDLFGNVASDATLSPCGTWRYRLTRSWDADLPQVCWVMLNPSTADAEQDDPTIRRCIGFSQTWGYGGLVVVNLYALRATDPRELAAHPDPVGPDNAEHLVVAAEVSALVVCAWGAHSMARRREQIAAELLGCGSTPKCCLGVTRAGSPRHPLYLLTDAQLVPYSGLKVSA